MAVSAANLVKAGLEAVYAGLAAVKTDAPAKAGVQALNEVATQLNRLAGYAVVDVALTADSTDADVAAFLAGDAAASAALGVIRVTTATFDLTDNALATAKGSAVAIGDIYTFPNGTTVAYLGNNAGHAFDMSGETAADFG